MLWHCAATDLKQLGHSVAIWVIYIFPCDLEFEKELFCTVSLQGVRDACYVNDGLPRLLPLYVMMFCHLYLPCR